MLSRPTTCSRPPRPPRTSRASTACATACASKAATCSRCTPARATTASAGRSSGASCSARTRSHRATTRPTTAARSACARRSPRTSTRRSRSSTSSSRPPRRASRSSSARRPRTRSRCTSTTTAPFRCRSPGSPRSRFRAVYPAGSPSAFRSPAPRSARTGFSTSPTRSSARSSSTEHARVSDSLEPVIGLEIHVQLRTRTKMFCGCEVSFGDPPNTHTCAVCLGLPGSLPVANARAVHFGLMIGLALESELAPRSIFHRKNYFYPDLPKGYQISQYDEPLCRGGRLGDVRINRVHLEEDPAKLLHVGAHGRIHGSDASIVDFNRGGTPLAEGVTEPDLRSPEQASAWLKLLGTARRRRGVSDVNMEEGSLRCDANISLRAAGSEAFGTKTELKNMNSFRFIERGIRAELERQRQILADGGQVTQETLHFDPASGALTSLRSKEEAHDYRYFPEPDLLPVAIAEEMTELAREAMPELPAERAARLKRELDLSSESAQRLAFAAELGDYFEAALAAGAEPPPPAQMLANWLTGDL